MSGAEAGAVLGLLSSIITIITTAKELYEAANDVHGLPDALSNAETKLPLVLMILKEAQSFIDNPEIESDVCDAFQKILTRGKKKANELLDIFEKVLPKERASTFDRYRSATRQLMKGSRVENLMKALFEDMQTLTSYFSCPKPMKAAVKEALDDFQSSSLPSKEPTDLKALREIKYNTHPSYSDLKSKKDLDLFLRNWFLPKSLPGASFDTDQADFLEKRFHITEMAITTCAWVFQTTEYSKLVDPSSASVLRVKGPSRCGKSVLLSAIIDRLRGPLLQGQPPRVLFCYARTGLKSISPTTLARVLLAQTLQWQNDQILKEFNAFYTKHLVLQQNDKKIEKELWRLLRTVLTFETGKIIIVVDGLDECTPPLICVQYLLKVATNTKAGILLSSRRESREIFYNQAIQSTLKKHDMPLLHLEITKERTYPDLMEYVAWHVSIHDSFSTKSQDLRDKFIKGVCDRADGMLLYASLLLKDLRRDKLSSTSAIDATIAGLPVGISEIYRDHLELPQRTIKGPETFAWVYCASSPLNWHELQSALAIGEMGYEEGEIVDDSCEAFIEYSCGQLIESFGESEQLRFIHPTVKDFLDENLGPGQALGIRKAHSLVAHKLLTFLEYSDLPFFSSPDIDDNFETIIKDYTSQRGRGLYSYATYNWYWHLQECDKLEDTKLERHVIRFIMSPSVVRWLKSAIIISHATGYGPTDSVSLTADVIHSLQTWMIGRAWSDPKSSDTIQVWIKDFVDLMQDWGKVLETQADWVHYIHHQLLPEGSCFQRILQDDADQSVVQFQPGKLLTRSSQIATWPNQCFATDLTRDLAFTYHERFISCYHMQTGLLTAEIAIPFPKWRGSLMLKRGVLCPQGKYLAAVFEVKSPWFDPVRAAIRSGLQLVPEEDGFALRLENPSTSTLDLLFAYMAYGIDEIEFVVCLLQLNHGEPARSRLFGLPSWAANPILVTGKESLRWDIDDVDFLTFSSDSGRLATPFGIFDLESGEKVDPWSCALMIFSKGGETTESIDVFNSITLDTTNIESEKSVLAFRGLHWQTGTESQFSEVLFPGIGHLLTVSNRGRFLLVLRVQTPTASKSSRLKTASGQQGSIEIWDCNEKCWTSLLLLDSSASRYRASWDLSLLAFPPRFSPEAKGVDEVNRVLLYVPPKWKLPSNVRNRNTFNTREAQLLLFEARKTGNPEEGFGPYPTLRHQLPADAFRRESASSALRLTILDWNPQFEIATVYFNRQVISMTQDHMKTSAVALLKTSQSKFDANNHINSHTKDYFATLFSADYSASFQVRLCVELPLGNDNSLQLGNNQLLEDKIDLGKLPTYEISVFCLRTGDMETEFFTSRHMRLPAISYPPLDLQNIYAFDEEHLIIGCLELELCHDYEGISIEIHDPIESVFNQALQCFKRKARPLKPTSTFSQTALIPKSSKIQYTIFSISEVAFQEDGMVADAPNQGAFLARSSKTPQQHLHIFEFSRRLENDVSVNDILLEANQFEVYFCVYNESKNDITWFVHSTSAGESSRSTGSIPETAWALHPQLPLLVWLLPGHRLRLSNIYSNDSPITIAESLMIEDNSTQPLLYSPNGRYLALKAQETFKYAWTYNLSQSVGSVILCDLVEGRTVVATPTIASNISIDIDDELLYVYNLTREGGIQCSSYELPSLELKQRQYLTFIPADCSCSTCGNPIQEAPNISIIEYEGVKFVALSHVPMKIGTTTFCTQACQPLMLRITSPPVELNLEAVHDALLTISSTKLFPKVLDEQYELRVDAFSQSYRSCTDKPGDGCTCPVCRANALPNTDPKITAVPQMQIIMTDFELAGGERIMPGDVEGQLKKFKNAKAKEMATKEENTFTPEDAKYILGEETFPWDTWEEFRDFMEEIKDEFDYEAHMQKFYDPENRGVGCRIPLQVQTFSFEEDDEPDKNFRWSSAIGVGWIEEDIKLIYRRMFSGSMTGARRWYSFPAFQTLMPRIQELTTDKSSKGQRFRRIYGKRLELGGEQVDTDALTEEPSPAKEDEKSEIAMFKITTRKGKQLKSRAPTIKLKENELWDPLLPINDVLDSLSDVVPGMGDIFKHRMKSIMMQDLVSEMPE